MSHSYKGYTVYSVQEVSGGRVDKESPAYILFYRTFRTLTRLIDQTIIDGRDDVKIPDLQSTPGSVLEARMNIECTYVPDPMEQYFIDDMVGRPRLSGSDEEIDQLLLEKTETSMPISDMAEIYFYGGHVQLMDPDDATFIRKILVQYLSDVNNGSGTAHGVTPPEEDIHKLEALLGAMENVVEQVTGVNTQELSLLDRLTLSSRRPEGNGQRNNNRKAARTSTVSERHIAAEDLDIQLADPSQVHEEYLKKQDEEGKPQLTALQRNAQRRSESTGHTVVTPSQTRATQPRQGIKIEEASAYGFKFET